MDTAQRRKLQHADANVLNLLIIVPDYEPEGRTFESFRERHFASEINNLAMISWPVLNRDSCKRLVPPTYRLKSSSKSTVGESGALQSMHAVQRGLFQAPRGVWKRPIFEYPQSWPSRPDPSHSDMQKVRSAARPCNKIGPELATRRPFRSSFPRQSVWADNVNSTSRTLAPAAIDPPKVDRSCRAMTTPRTADPTP